MNIKNIIIVVAILALAAAAFFFAKGQMGVMGGDAAATLGSGAAPANTAEQDADNKKLLAEISAMVNLPQEEPVIMEIKDAAAVKSQQAFFKDVSNGDIVIIFPTEKKALIYNRPLKKIINFGVIQVDAAPAKSATKAPTTAPVKDTKK